MINQTRWKHVEINEAAEKRHKAAAILENQSFLRIDAAQVDLRNAGAAVSEVLINSSTGYRGNSVDEIGGSSHAQTGDVVAAISIHGVRTDFFRGRDVRTGNDDAFGRGFICRCTAGWSDI